VRIAFVLFALSLTSSAPLRAETCSPSTFVRVGTYETPGQPGALALGEFTSDAAIDTLTLTYDGKLAVLPGQGDGSFGAPIESPTVGYSSYPYLVTGYFDSDGDLDVAFPYNSSVADYPKMFAAIGSIVAVAAISLHLLQRLEQRLFP